MAEEGTEKAPKTKKPAGKRRVRLAELTKKCEAEKPKKERTPREILTTAAICIGMACWAGVCIIASQVIVLLAMRLFINQEQLETPTVTTIYEAISYALAAVLAIGGPRVVSKKWGSSREELGLKELPTWTDIGLAPVAYVAYLLFSYVLTLVFATFSWFDVDQQQDVGFNNLYGGHDLLVAYVALCILAPIGEELILRGWLYGKLRRRIGMAAAILLTSVLFGALHGQWNVAIDTFAMSVVLCLQRELTGTIYSGILLHMLKNMIAFYLIYVIG